MEGVTEFRWIVNLLGSDLVKRDKKYKSGCKKDFERIACAGSNSNTFAKWFNSMIDKQVFIYSQDIVDIGGTKKTYIIIKNKLWEELKRNEFFPNVKQAFINQGYVEFSFKLGE